MISTIGVVVMIGLIGGLAVGLQQPGGIHRANAGDRLEMLIARQGFSERLNARIEGG
jgi:hypothetical protein